MKAPPDPDEQITLTRLAPTQVGALQVTMPTYLPIDGTWLLDVLNSDEEQFLGTRGLFEVWFWINKHAVERSPW